MKKGKNDLVLQISRWRYNSASWLLTALHLYTLTKKW